MKKIAFVLLLLLTSNIYSETINGHTVPPEPDTKVNNATLLGIDSNNNGFWQFCNDRETIFGKLLDQVVEQIPLEDKPIGIVSIFGEYCGKGINKGCAIHQLSKRFMILAVKTK